MEQSIKNAKILALIGFVQIIPFTFLTVLGFMAILPPIVWVLGMVLFVFYIKHAWGNIPNTKLIRPLWIYSIVFNSVGLLLPFYTVYLIIVGLIELTSGGSISNDAWELTSFLAVWSVSACVHVWLSVGGLKSVTAENAFTQQAVF